MAGLRKSNLMPKCNTTSGGRKKDLSARPEEEVKMKEITAIIRPFKLLDVVSELQKIENLPGVTISDIRGFGKSKAKDEKEKIMDGLIAYVQKVKIEVVVPDEMVEAVVNTIQANAHTGNPGDGKIFIYPVDDVIKIRTNEKGTGAI
jgi:nitrogen regulatory protein P-II 1